MDESYREGNAPTLESAVEKLVAGAEQIGLTVDDLIGFLQSGMSVAELLDYLEFKSRSLGNLTPSQ